MEIAHLLWATKTYLNECSYRVGPLAPEHRGSFNAVCDTAQKIIVVDAEREPDAVLKSLWHELGHAMFGVSGRLETRYEEEERAAAFALTLCAYFLPIYNVLVGNEDEDWLWSKQDEALIQSAIQGIERNIEVLTHLQRFVRTGYSSTLRLDTIDKESYTHIYRATELD